MEYTISESNAGKRPWDSESVEASRRIVKKARPAGAQVRSAENRQVQFAVPAGPGLEGGHTVKGAYEDEAGADRGDEVEDENFGEWTSSFGAFRTVIIAMENE